MSLMIKFSSAGCAVNDGGQLERQDKRMLQQLHKGVEVRVFSASSYIRDGCLANFVASMAFVNNAKASTEA